MHVAVNSLFSGNEILYLVVNSLFGNEILYLVVISLFGIEFYIWFVNSIPQEFCKEIPYLVVNCLFAYDTIFGMAIIFLASLQSSVLLDQRNGNCLMGETFLVTINLCYKLYKVFH